MSIRLAVFDMAGTTVLDSNFVALAFQKAFANSGIDIDLPEVNPLMGYHKPLAIQMLLEQKGIEFDAALIEAIHEDFEKEMTDFYEYDPAVKPMPGAEELFQDLKEKGVRIALNTGFSRTVAATIINRFQWQEKGLVDDFIGSNEVDKGRPYPNMITELMRRSGISNASEVIKIGDTTVDIEEGQNAGCGYIVAVTTGACSPVELREKNPTHIIDHLSEIPAILQ